VLGVPPRPMYLEESECGSLLFDMWWSTCCAEDILKIVSNLLLRILLSAEELEDAFRGQE